MIGVTFVVRIGLIKEIHVVEISHTLSYYKALQYFTLDTKRNGNINIINHGLVINQITNAFILIHIENLFKFVLSNSQFSLFFCFAR